MSIFKSMRNGVKVDLMDKFLEIKEDLVANAHEVNNRYEWYTKKYRGNRLNDINVGIFSGGNHNSIIQIFVRTAQGYIRNQVTVDYRGRMLNDDLKVRLNG